MKIKVRKIKRKHRKFFGWSDYKGSNDYGCCYGSVRQGGNHIDDRTRAEKRNDLERKEIENDPM